MSDLGVHGASVSLTAMGVGEAAEPALEGVGAESRGVVVSESEDSGAEDGALPMPCILVRVQAGGSPRVEDQNAMMAALLVRILGRAVAAQLSVGIDTYQATFRREVKTWELLAVQAETLKDYLLLTQAYKTESATLDARFRVPQTVELADVLYPSCGQPRAVQVAWCVQGYEAYLPGAPDLGEYEGDSAVVRLCFPGLEGLRLASASDCSATVQLVMEGSSEARSYGGLTGQAWCAVAEGVQSQLRRQGLWGKPVKATDPFGGKECWFLPWRIAY